MTKQDVPIRQHSPEAQLQKERTAIQTQAPEPCRICGEGVLSVKTEPVDGIISQYSVCSACGSEQTNADQVKANIRARQEYNRRTHHAPL